MAKKSAGKAAPAKKAAAPKKKAPAKKAPAKAAEPKPVISDELIGHVAGEVWNALHTKGPATLTALKKSIGQPNEVTLIAVGWLAREGKLDYVSKGKSLQMALR